MPGTNVYRTCATGAGCISCSIIKVSVAATQRLVPEQHSAPTCFKKAAPPAFEVINTSETHLGYNCADGGPPFTHSIKFGKSLGRQYKRYILLMEEILHCLGCPKCWFYTSIYQDLLGHPKWCGLFPSIVLTDQCVVIRKNKSIPLTLKQHSPLVLAKNITRFQSQILLLILDLLKMLRIK